MASPRHRQKPPPKITETDSTDLTTLRLTKAVLAIKQELKLPRGPCLAVKNRRALNIQRRRVRRQAAQHSTGASQPSYHIPLAAPAPAPVYMHSILLPVFVSANCNGIMSGHWGTKSCVSAAGWHLLTKAPWQGSWTNRPLCSLPEEGGRFLRYACEGITCQWPKNVCFLSY